MDLKVNKQKLTDVFKKYKYAAVILLAGVILMNFPMNTQKQAETSNITEEKTSTETTLSQELAKILSSIEGVGRVEVMLTVASGPQTIYQTDDDLSNTEKESSSRKDTVIITDSNRNETGLVSQVIKEKYQGAIVVCQGAGSPSVQLAIVEAVAKVTGLPSDRICVLKMK